MAMMLTIAEAGGKQCVMKLTDKCIGPSCMAWRYKDHETGPEWILAVKQAAEELGDTSPSRTKAAAHVMRNRTKYGLPETPTHGWCGLAGKPEWWAK
jgi:hypothetical protein